MRIIKGLLFTAFFLTAGIIVGSIYEAVEQKIAQSKCDTSCSDYDEWVKVRNKWTLHRPEGVSREGICYCTSPYDVQVRHLGVDPKL